MWLYLLVCRRTEPASAKAHVHAQPTGTGTTHAYQRQDLTGAHEHGDEPHTCIVDRPVVELLLQQIETADVILANKCDLASNTACVKVAS